jgi:hypothetical protein
MRYSTSIDGLTQEEWKKAWREGWRQGWREGYKEGARNELLAVIETTLKHKFGAAGSDLMTKVRNIEDLHRLRDLYKKMLRAQSLQTIRDAVEAAKKE